MDSERPPVDTGASFEQYFLTHYDRMVEWALMVTKNDHAMYRDIVHDVYLKLSNSRLNPGNISNPNGYLFAALRNAYLTKVKKATRMREVPLDSVVGSSLLRDPRALYTIHEELAAICNWACVRKATSTSASILILRYFHGYYTAETARIVNRSRNSVEARMTKARNEFLAYLNDPNTQQRARTRNNLPAIRTGNDVLADLRNEIFSHRMGSCPTEAHWKTLYRRNAGLSCEELSHLVSCPECLDSINQLLKMPLLAERHPLDTRGPQSVVEVIQKNQAAAAHGGAYVLLMLLNDLINSLDPGLMIRIGEILS